MPSLQVFQADGIGVCVVYEALMIVVRGLLDGYAAKWTRRRRESACMLGWW